ncbi:hypothetical protein GGF31_000946 [Allomyces arbusculus]|nr:hypothetical protein GGF31_000946 [Allomyces arbusculus]
MLIETAFAAGSCAKTYTVVAGDGCWAIANSNGIDVATLQSLNPGMDCAKIQVGQQLCVKDGGTGVDCAATYAVKSGDSCWSIANGNGLDMAALAALNPTMDCNKLQIGQQLCVRDKTAPTTNAPMPTTAPPAGTCAKKYTVVAGDYCWAIANSNGLDVATLQSLNPGLNCDALQLGQVLCVSKSVVTPTPTLTPTTPPAVPCSKQYTVVTGDYCWAIANSNGLDVAALQSLNPGLNCDALQLGQVLCVAGCTTKYTVSAGDSCWSIADTFGIDTVALSTLNPGLACDKLQVGQVVCVSVKPGGTTTRTRTTATSTTTAAPTSTTRPQVPACSKTIAVTTGGSCYDIWTKAGITESDLLALNPGLNCKALQVGQSVCVASSVGTCSSWYTSNAGDTCDSIADAKLIPRADFQTKNPHLRYVIKAGDLCYQIQALNQLTDSDFAALNPTVNCTQLQPGQRVCLRSKDTGCSRWVLSKAADTCLRIAADQGLELDDLAYINPHLDCRSKLPVGSQVCVTSRYTSATCRGLYAVVAGDTCATVAAKNGISADTLAIYNPGLMCSVLSAGQQLCVKTKPPVCQQWTLVNTTNLGCADFIARHNVSSVAHLEYYNQPLLDCRKYPKASSAKVAAVRRSFAARQSAVPIVAGDDGGVRGGAQGGPNSTIPDPSVGLGLPYGTLLCTSIVVADEGANHQFLSASASAFAQLSPDIQALFVEYRANPTDENLSRLASEIMRVLGKQSSRTLLLDLEQHDSFFKTLVKDQAPNRANYCELSQTLGADMVASAACMCGTSDPYLYCVAIFAQQFSDLARANLDMEEIKQELVNGLRQQHPSLFAGQNRNSSAFRSPLTASAEPEYICDWSGVLKALGIHDRWVSGKEPFGQCYSFGCCTEAMNLKIIYAQQCINGRACVPVLNSAFSTKGDSAAYEAKLAENTYVEIAYEVCISSKIKFISKILGDPDKKGTCIAGFHLRLYFFRGVISFDMEISLFGIIRATIAIAFKAWEPLAAVCNVDYCKKWYCSAPIGSADIGVYFGVEFFKWKKIVADFHSTPEAKCDRGKLPAAPAAISGDELTQRMGGKILGGYYPNWSYYHSGLMGIDQMAPQVTHIMYGFSTISYSPELDVWYLDSADLWADMGDCVGVDKIMCQTKDKVEGCMPFGRELECEPGKISLVPTLGAGAGTGKCPTSTCYNAGGVPNPPRTIPCNTIFDERMGLRTKGGTPQMCGQFNWILNGLPIVSPDTRVILLIGGWYDSSYWSQATSPKYIDKLVESIGSWLDVIPFDGVDIDWEFPGFEHGGEPLPGAPKVGDPEVTTDCSKGACQYGDRRDDGARYISLITKLRQRLNRSGLRGDGRSRHGSPLEISIAAPAGFDKLEKLQLKALCDNLDRFHLVQIEAMRFVARDASAEHGSLTIPPSVLDNR